MDAQGVSARNGSTWTNQKHLHFLNAMESVFVHTMLKTKPRLDRYLPDSSDSTLDLKTTYTRKKHASSVDVVGSKAKIDGKADKRKRRLSPRSRPSQDQVVPQLVNKRADQDQSHQPTAPSVPSAN